MNRNENQSGDHSENNPLKNNSGLPPLAREAVRTKHLDRNSKEASATVAGSQDESKGAERSRTSEVSKGAVKAESSEDEE